MRGDIHLDVRVSRLMSREMNFQVSFRREPISANVTFERSFTRVRSDMNLEGAVTPENFVTVATFVAEKWVVRSKFCIENRHVGWLSC